MTNLVNHKGFWLQADAAASLARFEKDHGIIEISSAGRTEADQQAIINRWNKGGASNRPPYLYKPAEPASTSRHVVDGGIALDTNNQDVMHKYGQQYGWYFNYAYDLVHFEYEISKDLHRGTTAPASNQSASDRVKSEQQFLNAVGQHLTVDGIAGPKFQAAVKVYQTYLKSKKFYTGAIDGVWGVGTEAAHAKDVAASAAAASKPAHVATTSGFPSVKDQQTWMNLALASHLKVDGVNGPATKAAIKRYQIFLRSWGYKGVVDGVWGAATQAAHQKFFNASK